MTHSPIQKLCTDLSSDPQFVAGSLYGLRQWSVSMNGDSMAPVLYGHNGGLWELGNTLYGACTKTLDAVVETVTVETEDPENIADQLLSEVMRFFAWHPSAVSVSVDVWSERPVRVTRRALSLDFGVMTARSALVRHAREELVPSWQRTLAKIMPDVRPGSVLLSANVTSADHVVATPTCTCGYYAYTDAESLYENSYDSSKNSSFFGVPFVFGIIKASGHITQGTKGFRAEQAEIVALTVPLTERVVDAVGGDEQMETVYSWTGSRVRFRSAPVITVDGWEPDKAVAWDIDPNFYRFSSLDTLLEAYRGPEEAPAL
jgi:hypothetical protein